MGELSESLYYHMQLYGLAWLRIHSFPSLRACACVRVRVDVHTCANWLATLYRALTRSSRSRERERVISKQLGIFNSNCGRSSDEKGDVTRSRACAN